VVVVEGQWGRIEEISLTYVVVRIWDDRRLLLPISYFLERPFENWTRRSADLLAAVHIWVDYTVPVAAVRRELGIILQASKLWDGGAWNLQVTDVNADAMELRALMAARDATTAWDLRCEVRERLLRFLQCEYPTSLPQRRVRLAGQRGD
jgi:small-conductance mechanosensitive channel